MIKYFLYALFIAAALGLYWFLPKYTFIHKNPQYCVEISSHFYYCGSGNNLNSLYQGAK